MTFAVSNTRTVPLDPRLEAPGMSEKSAGDPVRVGGGGVVLRRELFERLSRAGRVTEVSGPAGSGKSVLLRSWIDEAGLGAPGPPGAGPGGGRGPPRGWD